MDHRSRARFFLAAGLLALVGLWWVTRSKRIEEPSPAVAQPPTSASAVASHAPPRAPEFPPEMPPAETPFPMAAPSPAKFEDVLARYKEFAVYPPWSRPHNDSTRYKLTWNQTVVSTLPFGDKPGNPIHYKFAADRAHVLPGQSLTSWFTAWRGDDETKRVPIKIVEAWVMVTSGSAPGRAVKLTFTDAAGNLVYTSRFQPSAHPELKKAQSAQIMAHVEIDGIQKPIVRDFTYSPRDVLKFGAAKDVVRNGSLVLEMDVEVADAGEYTCEANLMTGDGTQAIGYAKEKPSFAVGPAKLAFTFFGKVLRDGWHDGPYQVRDIRCVLRQSGDEENVWVADERTHMTQAYLVETFSDAEWQAPEKSSRISLLEKLLAQSKSGENPNPNAPKHIHVDLDGKEQVIVGADGKKLALPAK